MTSVPASSVAPLRDVRLQQAHARDWARSAGGMWADAESLWRHMSDNTNQPRAVAEFDWDSACPAHARILDLACGAGWLTALLSKRDDVARVTAWDSSPTLLTDVLPQMVTLLDGDATKIEPVCGEFVPLTLADQSVDLVVMSSAFHHCPEPFALLAELRRVLVAGGSVLLLNETPWRLGGMLWFDFRLVAAHLLRLAGRRNRWPGSVADDHVLYDPTLGDRAYTMSNWRSMTQEAGWHLRAVSTGLTSYPRSFRAPSRFEPELTHFVLHPRS